MAGPPAHNAGAGWLIVLGLAIVVWLAICLLLGLSLRLILWAAGL